MVGEPLDLSSMTSNDNLEGEEDGEEQEHRRLAEEMHARWLAGEAKSQLEIVLWGDGKSCGERPLPGSGLIGEERYLGAEGPRCPGVDR